MAFSPSQHRGTKTAIVILIAITVVLGGAVVGTALFLQGKLDAGIERFEDPFDELTARPAAHVSTGSATPVNFLVLGSDSRVAAGDPESWERGAQRTDAIMVAQLSADRQNAFVMSLPRDSWVDIPGHGEDKLNAAFSYGGPALTVETVENLTGIRIDHVAIADFEAFAAVTDTVGGVSISLTEPLAVDDEELLPGDRLLTGEQALAYVRQRQGLAGGDLGRIQRQHTWVGSILDAVRREGILTDPIALGAFLDSVGRTLAVDESLTLHQMRNLAFSARDLRAEDMVFMTAPTEGIGRSPDGTQSTVELDGDALAELCAAFTTGTVDQYLSEHPDVAVPLHVAGR